MIYVLNPCHSLLTPLFASSIEFTVLNKDGDSAFGMLQGLWSSGEPFNRKHLLDSGGLKYSTSMVSRSSEDNWS